MRIWMCSFVLVFSLSACGPQGPEGLRATPDGSGPQVVFDLAARPFPDIPFPNDLGTRPDASSPTGRRVNVSLIAPTRLEERVRSRIDQLDGFSTFAPMTVRFEKSLDLVALLARHGSDLDYSDDAIFLIDLQTGQPVPLDIGYGAYPYTLERPNRYFPNDPRGQAPNLVFETEDEDADGDGVLDPGEDTDGDGVLDQPNTLFAGGDPIDDGVDFYERETDTLILRPLLPLHQRREYAVVLTDRLVDQNGQPVRSPFAWINHTDQTPDLADLDGHLQALPGAPSLDQVAFAWKFTTQSTTTDLEHLRMGLYGRGPLGWLAQAFPPDTLLECGYDDPSQASINPFVMPIDDIQGAMRLMIAALFGQTAVTDEMVASFDDVEYLVMGRARVPQLMEGLTDIWEIDAERGDARVIDAELPWILAMPRERPELGIVKPFPVAIYVHGTGGSRMESLGFAGHMAKYGIATVGFDVYLHGLVLDEEQLEDFRPFFAAYGVGGLIDSLVDNRTVDINNDGRPDEAGNFWSYDVFRIRDSIRQGALDVLRLVQVLRGFDSQRTWCQDADDDGRCELEGLAGDFDGDGQVDLVGPDGPYFLFGISLGGIVGSVAAPLEPAIVAAAPISSGGGLSDVAVRSLQTGVPEMVLLPFVGPLIYNLQDPDSGQWQLAFYLADGRFEASLPVHALPALPGGAVVTAVNRANQEQAHALVDDRGLFRLSLGADVGDPIEVSAVDPDGQRLFRIDSLDRDVTWQGFLFPAGGPLVAPSEGHGAARQTPDFRRFLQISQTVLDPGDPVNYAPGYHRQALYADHPDYGNEASATRLALILTAGDMNVPISTGVSQARAAGLIPFGPDDVDPRYDETPQRVLIDGWVNEGLERLRRFAGPPWNDDRDILLDPDDLSEGLDGFDAPRLAQPLRLGFDAPGGGLDLVRFFYVGPRGAHGLMPPDPSKTYPLEKHAYNAIGRYFQTLGTEWHDEICQADDSCQWIP